MGARSENLAIIVGNLTRDPELRQTSEGHKVASFGVATNREWITAERQKKEDTQLHEVVAWDGLATVCDEFLVKGSKVYVRGRLQTRTWDDERGFRHYRTEIVADKVIVLDDKSKGSGEASDRAVRGRAQENEAPEREVASDAESNETNEAQT